MKEILGNDLFCVIGADWKGEKNEGETWLKWIYGGKCVMIQLETKQTKALRTCLGVYISICK